MAGTVRELDFRIITYVAVLFVLVLITTVAASVAWFRNEIRIVEESRWAPNAALAELEAVQTAELNRPASGLPIREAMQQVAKQH